MKGWLQEPSKQVLMLVHVVGWPHCQLKSMVSVWRNYHSGIAFISDIIFLSHLYNHFVELHSNLNMLSCPKGEFISDITVRDFSAELLSECCKDLNWAFITATNRWNSITISNSNKYSYCRWCSSRILS